MNNMELYEQVRKVPQEAQKTIQAGRLKGMTDINPMWRIKTLTEQFGPCGIGWYPEVIRFWIEEGAEGEKTANVHLKLYIKVGGEWSKGIEGIGGAKLLSMEKNGLYTDDECFKKAYTDALSVACKLLGVGADVYWEKDRTKYNPDDTNDTLPPKKESRGREEKPNIGKGATPPITEKELKNYGVQDIPGTIKWIEGKIEKPLAELDEEEKEVVRELLKRKQEEREAANVPPPWDEQYDD